MALCCESIEPRGKHVSIYDIVSGKKRTLNKRFKMFDVSNIYYKKSAQKLQVK